VFGSMMEKRGWGSPMLACLEAICSLIHFAKTTCTYCVHLQPVHHDARLFRLMIAVNCRKPSGSLLKFEVGARSRR
jgi:hypothetical protein